MMRIVTTILMVALATEVRAGFDEGVAAFVRGDYTTAFQEWGPPARSGDTFSQYALGLLYANGRGVRRDYNKAAQWFLKAAEFGHIDAQFELGEMYRAGQGVPQDNVEAVGWYKKAAKQGHADAQYALGKMYYEGNGVTKDYDEAANWFFKAADLGHAEAQFKLGSMFDNGEGLPRNDWEAVWWWRKAAELGHAGAQNNLGVMYLNGEGEAQDYAEAVRWFRKAAEQGDAVAQDNLGETYASGDGVPQDYAQAVRWFLKAADQGYAHAQNNIAKMYRNGHGVPQNYVQAHKWYNLAASRAKTAEVRDDAVKGRDYVALRMTTAQVAEAQRLAREWRPNQQAALPTLTTPGPAITRQHVARIQRDLASLGYDPGPVDGMMGQRTRAAIRAFQASVGLPVTGEISDGLEKALRAAKQSVARRKPAPPTPTRKRSTGSGFIVSAKGHILTNHHVVKVCRTIQASTAGMIEKTGIRVRPKPDAPITEGELEVLGADARNDLALLKSAKANSMFATFRGGRGVRTGEDVMVTGFPLHGLLASDMNVSKGTVSALAGPRNDRRVIQITAPVQPGNSGGPVLDNSGNVVAVVVGKLDAIKIARATGALPENVNFAISGGTARAFLDAHDVPYKTAYSDKELPTTDIAAKAKGYTVLIECWK